MREEICATADDEAALLYGQHSFENHSLLSAVEERDADLRKWAAEKYDYRLGYRFSTYAFNWINQYLQRSCQGNGSLISYPAHVHHEINGLHRLRTDFKELYGAEPDMDELAQMADMPLDKVRKLRGLSNITVSLEHTLGTTGDVSLGDTLVDTNTAQTSALAEDAMLLKLVNNRLGELESMERFVVCRRFGLLGHKTQTFRELAGQLEISAEWARQLEKSALKKLSNDKGLAEAFEMA